MRSVDILRERIVWLVAGLVLIYAGYTTASLMKKRRSMRKHAAVRDAAAVGFALLLLSQPAGALLLRWTGLRNLGWLLGYCVGAMALCSIGLFTVDAGPYRNKVLWRRVVLIGFAMSVTLMAILYAVYVASSPEWPTRVPRNWVEVFFSGAFFVYGDLVVALSVISSRAAVRQETNPAIRSRAIIASCGAISAAVCFGAKTVFLALLLFGIYWPWLDQLTLLAMGLTAVFYILGVLPHRLYRFRSIYDPVSYLKAQFVLSDLLWLREQVRQLRVQDPEGTQIDWWQRLTRPSWATYATVIGLLDGHKMLQGYLSAETDAGTHEHSAAKEPHQQRLTRRPIWTNGEREWATLIALALRMSGVDSTDEYDDIVVALRDVGRQLRHSQHEVPPIESASISQYGA